MWIYAIIFAIIIGFQLLNNFGSSPVTITKGRFMNKMLVSGDVEMVKAYQEAGEYKVDVYLKKEALSDSKYEDAPTSSLGENTGPHYKFNVPNFEVLERSEEHTSELN